MKSPKKKHHLTNRQSTKKGLPIAAGAGDTDSYAGTAKDDGRPRDLIEVPVPEIFPIFDAVPVTDLKMEMP